MIGSMRQLDQALTAIGGQEWQISGVCNLKSDSSRLCLLSLQVVHNCSPSSQSLSRSRLSTGRLHIFMLNGAGCGDISTRVRAGIALW